MDASDTRRREGANLRFWLAALCLALLIAIAGRPGGARADSPGGATAAHPATDSATAVAAAAPPTPKGVQIVGVPVPISDPALGSGVAPVLMLLYTPKGSGGTWTTGVAGIFTSTKSKALAVLQKAHFDKDKYRLTVLAGYGNFNLKFYGVGGALASSNKSININQSGEIVQVEGLIRVAPNTYVGARYYLLNINTTLPTFRIRDITISPPQLRSISSEIGPSAVYDTRDTEYGPTRGLYVTGQWLFAVPALGSKFQYNKLTIDANAYWGFGPSTVLAGRLSICTSGKNAPFYDLCLYGSRNDLRGYASGQYRDHRMIAAQLELRQHLFWRIGAVVFAGVGGTAPGSVSSNPFAKATFLPDAGVGLRFLASKDYRLNLSVDAAVGANNSKGLYIYIGEAF